MIIYSLRYPTFANLKTSRYEGNANVSTAPDQAPSGLADWRRRRLGYATKQSFHDRDNIKHSSHGFPERKSPAKRYAQRDRFMDSTSPPRGDKRRGEEATRAD